MSFSCHRPGHFALTLVLALNFPSFGGMGAPQATNSGQLLLIAGDAGDAGVVDGPTQVARLMALAGITVDGRGNVYVTDGHAIRKISAEGRVTTVAGRVGEWGDTDGAGANSRFNNPQGLAADAAANVYVADRDNHAIRKITPDGVVSTLAGSAAPSGTDDGRGTDARFFRPSGIAVDGEGNLFVSDTRNFTIRKVTPAGAVSTLAGQGGEAGSTNGPRASARFASPLGITVDGPGNVYVADFDLHVIRKISTSGVVTTFAGQVGAPGTADGNGASGRFFYPAGLAIDNDGNLYVGDSHSLTIRRITPGGIVTTVAGLADRPGTSDGPGATARFNSVHGVAVDRSGNVYATDDAYVQNSAATGYVKPAPSGTVRRIDRMGVVTTIAGRSSEAPGNADGVGAAARFASPSGIVADRAGTLYVADPPASTVRKITPSGQVTTLAGKAGVRGHKDGPRAEALFDGPSGIALASGTLYVTDSVSGVIRKITRDGVVSTFAGAAGVKGSVDGMGTAARFNSPSGIAVDGTGNLFVTDGWANNIRKITPAGKVTTWANKTGQRGSTDGPAEQARFVVPTGIAIDHTGNVYVCDYGNRTIRRITQYGAVSTFAGRAPRQGRAEGPIPRSLDGTGMVAEFAGPLAIAVDDTDNLYVADGNTIRKITRGGVVTTVAGVDGQAGIKLGKLPGRLENTSGLALIDSSTLVATERFSVLKIVLDGLGSSPAVPLNR